MNLRFFATLCAMLLFVGVGQAAGPDKPGLGDPEADVPLRLTIQALGDEVKASDPRVAQTRAWFARATKASGESDEFVAAASLRLSRYLFDVTKIRVSPLEVLEAFAKHAPPGKPLSETANRYFDLRAHKKLDHAATLAAMAGK